MSEGVDKGLALIDKANADRKLENYYLFQASRADLLRRLGHGWNHKRVYRVYCALKLNKRHKGKRRLPTRNPAPLQVSQTMNECWSADFMSDALWEGPRFRTFNVVDDFNREALAIVVQHVRPPS